MNELTFQTKLVESAREHGGYARKLAHRFVIGIPDLIVHLPQFTPFLLECKWISDPLPEMSRTIKISAKQTIELQRINTPNGVLGNTAGIVVGFKLDNKFCLKAFDWKANRITLEGGLNDPELITADGKYFDMPLIAKKLQICKVMEVALNDRY